MDLGHPSTLEILTKLFKYEQSIHINNQDFAAGRHPC